MNIVEEKYKWSGSLSNRTDTKYIIIHHRAGNGDAQSIHRMHISDNGWVGIGYHFYVRKDGTIYRGRPLYSIGAHCKGKNKNYESVGICFEGDYQSETMPDTQLKAGRELVQYLKGIYPNAEIKKHGDFMSTSCPGKNFPFNEIISAPAKRELVEANDIIWELMHGPLKVEISEVDRAVQTLEDARREDSSLYWILRKIVNR